MPGHINTTNIRIQDRVARAAWVCGVLAAALLGSQSTFAKPGGEPLVLDTQTGIHSGVSGTVLQSGPLGGPGMVPMATLPGPPQEAEPLIVVSPYVEYSTGQSTVPAPPGGSPRPRVPRTPRP